MMDLGLPCGLSTADERIRLLRRHSPPQAVGGVGNPWLDRARHAVSLRDYQSAAYAARQACATADAPAEAWRIRADAHARLGQFDEAVSEAAHAVALEPEATDHLMALGGIFEELGNWHGALDAYHEVARRRPDAVEPRLGAGTVLLRAGAVDDAVKVLSAVHAGAVERGDDAARAEVGDVLALALVESAERIPWLRNQRCYVITTTREATEMGCQLKRAAQVGDGREVRALVARVRRFVDQCAQRRLSA